MTNPRDDGEADDIAKQEAESVADAKRRLAKRSGTNPRDDGEAARWLQQILDGTSAKISSGNWTVENSHWHGITMSRSFAQALSRQLAEARAEKIALQNALVIIDAIAVRHEKGGLGKAQRVAREALAHVAAVSTTDDA